MTDDRTAAADAGAPLVTPPMTLDQLNAAPPGQALALLDGLYEHSPWIAEAALAERPFKSLAHLKLALVDVVRHAGLDRQSALLRAHPELAGRQMAAGTLTSESTHEQTTSGLTNCSVDELATLRRLNDAYTAKFGWPFLLAVRGPRGNGLTRAEIIATFERRLQGHPDFERAECLRNIHRIAELRLNDKFGALPALGNQVWDRAEALARFSDGFTDPGYADPGQLTVTYLTDAHRACAAQLADWMRAGGFDEVSIDAVGNVVGVYHAGSAGGGAVPAAAATAGKRLLTGSHYDTVRNGGKYDGRLGILVPMACVAALHRQGRRLPYGFEVVGFAEEEGQRYKATFLGSGALVGQFDAAWLDQVDADGVTMRAAMANAGLEAVATEPTGLGTNLRASAAAAGQASAVAGGGAAAAEAGRHLEAEDGSLLRAIAALRRDPARYLGFVETHIEQGPVLNELDLPLGVVTSINGSVRYVGEVVGVASHAGTTPMDRRRDAATAVAELALYVERRAAADSNAVGTVGLLAVPNGSINVVPGRCQFSLDLRATTDAVRDALAGDVLAELKRIVERRGLHVSIEETMRAAAAPSDAAWQARWERAVEAIGLPVFRLPSGAGHDAMKLHEAMPQAMLFLRGGNSGISHNPLEAITNDDAQLCVEAFQALLDQLAEELS